VPLSVITSQQKEESMAPVAVAAPATQEEPAVKANRYKFPLFGNYPVKCCYWVAVLHISL